LIENNNMSNKITYFIVFLGCITPLIINPFTFDYYYLPKITVVYWITLSMISIVIINKEPYLCIKDKSEKIILGYLAILILSTLNSLEISISIWGAPEREEGLLAICSYILIFILTKRYYKFNKKHVYLFIITSTIVSLYGILQYFGFDPIPKDYLRGSWSGRAYSTMGNPNFLGAYLVLVLPIVIYSYIKTKRNIFLLCTQLIYFSLLCTMTRGSWIGFGFSLLIIIFFSFKHKEDRNNIYVLLAILSIVTVAFNFISDNYFISRLISIFGDFKTTIDMETGYEKSGAGRMFIWNKTLVILKDYPLFGVGIDNLYLEFNNRFGNEIFETFGYNVLIDKAHNEYLHIAVTTGIPSLVIYVVFLREIITKGLYNINSHITVLPILTSVIGYLVQAFFNISVVSVSFLLWIFIGILYRYSSNEE